MLGIIGSDAQQGDGDGSAVAAIGLDKEFVFEIAVKGFEIGTSSDTDSESVRDAIIKPESERCIVKTKEIIGAAV